MILCSIFLFNKDTPIPSLFTLLPTLGTSLVIMYASVDTVVGKLLSYKAMVWIGLLSYSAYLWHQPLFAFTRYYIGQNDLGFWLTGLLILLAMVFAWLTWRFVELPLKNKIHFKRPFIFKFSIATSLFFIIFGYGFSKIFISYGTEEKSAKLLVNHPSIYFSGIRNEAIFAEHLINVQLGSPDVVVIGSSRIMQIRSPDKRKFLNLGVSGSALRDDIGMIYLVDKKLSPATLIIGADHWLFSSEVIDGRYKSLEKAYFASIKKLFPENNVVSRFSFIKSLVQNIYDRTTYSMRIPENDLPENNAKKRSDGSHVYATAYGSQSQKEIEDGFNAIIGYKIVSNYTDAKEHIAREAAKNEFTKLVEEQIHKRTVVLVLSPYHPKLYARLKYEFPMLLDIEKDFRKIAKELGVKIIGSYDPSVNDCTINDFVDGMHPDDLCMEKIIDTLH